MIAKCFFVNLTIQIFTYLNNYFLIRKVKFDISFNFKNPANYIEFNQTNSLTKLCTYLRLYFFLRKVKFDRKKKQPIEFEKQKQEKMTANLVKIIINVNHLTTFLNLGNTWINIENMQILIYPSAVQFCIDNLMRWCFFFQNSEQITGDTKSS